MPAIISHPFRLLPNGNVATIEADSDLGDAEGIAVLVLTRRGERSLVPGFGVTDPAFAGLEPSEVAAGVALYGPPVTITAVRDQWLSDTEQAVAVAFE